jgi:hypothetical protein
MLGPIQGHVHQFDRNQQVSMSTYGKNLRSLVASVAGGPSRYAKEVEGKNNNHLKFNLLEIYDGSPEKIRQYFL